MNIRRLFFSFLEEVCGSDILQSISFRYRILSKLETNLLIGLVFLIRGKILQIAAQRRPTDFPWFGQGSIPVAWPRYRLTGRWQGEP